MECTIPQSQQPAVQAARAPCDRRPAGDHAGLRSGALLAGLITAGQFTDGVDDGTVPYCTSCSEWVGLFAGTKGWQHFTGDPAPTGIQVLFDAGHKPAIAWTVPPGRSLSPAGVVVLRLALADALACRGGDGAGDLARAGAYLALGRQLGIEVSQS